MSDDGADQGVLPNRALKTILGGEGQPKEEEKMTPQQMHMTLMDQPDDFKDIEGSIKPGDDGSGYEKTTLWLAKQFLIILESGVDENENESQLYNRMKIKNGQRDYGMTGFMVGWANNAARFALKKKSQPNPAIMTIEDGK